ncbi:hypothetical protein LPJ66_008992, partial [Kickxella alabastrina]
MADSQCNNPISPLQMPIQPCNGGTLAAASLIAATTLVATSAADAEYSDLFPAKSPDLTTALGNTTTMQNAVSDGMLDTNRLAITARAQDFLSPHLYQSLHFIPDMDNFPPLNNLMSPFQSFGPPQTTQPQPQTQTQLQQYQQQQAQRQAHNDQPQKQQQHHHQQQQLRQIEQVGHSADKKGPFAQASHLFEMSAFDSPAPDTTNSVQHSTSMSVSRITGPGIAGNNHLPGFDPSRPIAPFSFIRPASLAPRDALGVSANSGFDDNIAVASYHGMSYPTLASESMHAPSGVHGPIGHNAGGFMSSPMLSQMSSLPLAENIQMHPQQGSHAHPGGSLMSQMRPYNMVFGMPGMGE